MSNFKELQKEIQRQAAEKLRRQQLIECFSAENLDSRATEKQIEFFKAMEHPGIKYRFFVAGNQSGKTQSCVRDLTWFIQEIHPYWQRPTAKCCNCCKSTKFEIKGAAGAETFICNECGNIWKDWSDINLCVIAAGQDNRNIETNIWPRIKSLLLNPLDWKERRVGGTLQSVKDINTGNMIIFLTHGYSAEEARAATQGYTLQYVWVDELPSLEFMEELQRRVDRYLGYFTASYTPKKTQPGVKRFMEGLVKSGIAWQKTYSKYDNPHFASIKEFEQKKLEGLSAARRRTIEIGDWPEAESSVYGFNYDFMTVESLPEGYSKRWPHMEIVDPAMINKMGYLLVVFDDRTGVWYTVKSEYIEHEWAPSRLVVEVDNMSKEYNVQWWASDTEQFFIKEARERFPHKHYWIPYKKTSRKKELIKNLQQALTEGSFKILREHTNLIDEIEECKYNEAGDKIIAATKYHLLDCAQYFIDKRPSSFNQNTEKSFYQQCREATIKHEMKQQEASNPKSSYVLRGRTKSLFSRRGGRRW